ncbi:hypothetical protein [Trujillonella humicola]|uniref:hypothetical protein n=1 Tax=Trujillonella humicola TaxID=3383699 RepID=UPI0039067AE1
MSRRRALLLPVVGLLLAGCLRLEAPAAEEPGGPDEPPLLAVTPGEDAGTATLDPECPPPVPGETSTAEDWNEAFDELDLRYWQSADLGASAMLSDGRVVWLWGDTIRAEEVMPELPRMVDNSMFVTSGTCISQVTTESRGPILPRDPNQLTIWPMSVLRLDPRPGDAADVTDVVVVFCSRVQRGDRMWDFVVRGTTVAVYTVGGDGVPQLAEAAQLTPDTPDLSSIHWGAGSVLDGDWIYLYGTRHTGEAYTYGHELFVSRIPTDRFMDGSAIEYWDGADWQAEPSRSAPVLGAVEGVSQTLSVDLVDGLWVAYSKLGGDIEDVAALWVSDRPVGPFTVQPVLDSPGGMPPAGQDPDDEEVGYLQYTPLAHPDLPTEPGQMLVAVSRNVTDYEMLLDTPQLGRPLFAEVPRPGSPRP